MFIWYLVNKFFYLEMYMLLFLLFNKIKVKINDYMDIRK